MRTVIRSFCVCQHARDIPPSYLHGDSALSRTSSRHSGGKGGHGRATLIPDTVLPVYSSDVRFLVFQTVADTHGPVGSQWTADGQHSVVRRLGRLTGTVSQAAASVPFSYCRFVKNPIHRPQNGQGTPSMPRRDAITNMIA
jgi:hypothetical protein